MTFVRKTLYYLQAVLKLDPDETLDGDNALYFKQPSELLELFNKLESENLSLIQACQQVVHDIKHYFTFNFDFYRQKQDWRRDEPSRSKRGQN